MAKSSVTSQNKLASSAKSNSTDARSMYTGAALGMSWQLAVVVLLPILGGYKLDDMMHTQPVWTLIGLVVALVTSILVIRRALKAVNNFSVPTSDESGADTSKGGKA